MKTAVRPIFRSKTICSSKSYVPLIEKENSLINLKFYQKLFVLLISFSTILILPESVSELGKICVNYNAREVCNVW